MNTVEELKAFLDEQGRTIRCGTSKHIQGQVDDLPHGGFIYFTRNIPKEDWTVEGKCTETRFEVVRTWANTDGTLDHNKRLEN